MTDHSKPETVFLKPCPLCDGCATLNQAGNGVVCLECGCRVSSISGEAAIYWNRRVSPAQTTLPELPDDDADFTPELARKIIAKYQTIIRNLTSSVPPQERTAPPVGGYLVWSNEHRAWWRPNSCGYVKDIRGAGRYTRDDAIKIASAARRGWSDLQGAPDEIAIAIADTPDHIKAIFGASHSQEEKA